MEIPDRCKSWLEKIKCGNEQAQKILENLRRDNCIKSEISEEFFKRLEAKGDPCSPEDAKNTAIGIVTDDPDRFVCQGGRIPSDSFNTLFRLEQVTNLGRLIPINRKKIGIKDQKTFDRKQLSDDEINDLIHDFKEVKLGNLLDIVWVTDAEESGQIGSGELVDRLGLTPLAEAERCLKIVYKREKAKKNLHLPRSFDGIDQGPFEVVEDCNADAGKTVPLSLPREQGLPEVVHRGCRVKPEIFTVESIV
ncbi:MAG: hypothetical protein CEE38_12520 [Planctomycetes bacterium B3_Pla]|nr:MAG: hypothetical protein CEE38_12520 [Planctomycetes bacterium B3_Pla]